TADTGSPGTPLHVARCEGGQRQEWVLAPDGTLRGPENTCATVRGGRGAEGAPIELRACEGGPEQSWSLKPSGQLEGRGEKCCAPGIGEHGAGRWKGAPDPGHPWTGH